MCGISGIWNLDGAAIDPAVLTRFNDSLTHRGPDGGKIWLNKSGSLGLGHRRLAIIDTSHEADQPMAYANGRYHIVFNGEIYNFLEIRAELQNKGFTFHTNSDTEVILAAYILWGADMLMKFNGMWAFVIYDAETETLFIARDRYGVKPFHYLLLDNRFAFASELKAFRELDNFRPCIDENTAIQFLKKNFSIEGSTHTLLKNIKRLQAGHYALLNKEGKMKLTRWWKTTDHLETPPLNFAEQAERFHELFVDAVKLRMRSDVAIGSSLSGGFDSTAVVCTMAELGKQTFNSERQASQWQKTYIASFPGASNDETPQAREVLDYTGLQGKFLEIGPNDALQDIKRILYDFDDVSSILPTPPWLIYRAMRADGTFVSIDGHGADELMGAYRTPDFLFFNELPSLLIHPGKAISTYRSYINSLDPRQRPQSSKAHLHLFSKLMLENHPSLENIRKLRTGLKHVKDKWISPPSQRFLLNRWPQNPSAFELVAENDRLPDGWDLTNTELYHIFHNTILPSILRNFDRLSMAHGIEIRSPFLDYRLVNYCFSLPGSAKVGHGFAKRIGREAMKGHMPESIRASKIKIGFNPPMPEWLNGPLHNWAIDLLDNIKEHPLINIPLLKRHLIATHQAKNWNWVNAGDSWKYLHYLWFEQNFLKK